MPGWTPPPGWARIRRAVFAAKGRACFHCGAPATSVDHYPVPAALGGAAVLANLVPACQRCNSSRGAALGNRLRPGAALRRGPSRRPARRW